MIRIENLTKTFGDVRALDHANLTVPKGSVYGLVGPNGAGKSTLIRHLMGVYRPDSGDVFVDGASVFDNTAAKAGMFCIYDDIYYYLSATTRDMKRLYQRIYPRFDGARYEALREVFSQVRETTPLRRLSKGMLKQSAFWLALSCRPEILVLDEPVDGLDPVMRRQVWSLLMCDVEQEGTTVLVSSHNLRELEDVCDHVGILHRGQVLLERSLHELQSGVTKVQVLFDRELPEPELEILHRSNTGKMHTWIVRGNPQEVQARLSALEPVYLEALPLSLEEIFIYELGGADYEVKDILL